MENELRNLPPRRVPDDYADRVMLHIAQAEARRRVALYALGALTFALMLAISVTLPEVLNDLIAWISDPMANLLVGLTFEVAEAMPNLLLIAVLLGIGLSGVSAIFLAQLNEQLTGRRPRDPERGVSE